MLHKLEICGTIIKSNKGGDKMFIDYVKITIKAGNGGDGSAHFLRDKHHIAGGPDGGNGGKGGDVYFVADNEVSNLVDFYYKKKFVAGNGGNGGGQNCNGKRGEDIVIKVPRGTVIKDEDGNVIADIVDSEPIRVLRGGKGGRGNSFYATATRQTPNFAQTGEVVKTYKVVLELKLIADVGLVGLPNVGKSTILSVVSNAKPKIANYHFTTLNPNVGVVRFRDKSFVVADIPGLIEGASEGAGLGHRFLRHIERTRMLVHVVDISGIEGTDPVESFNLINEELRKYSETLSSKNMIIALNKCDLLPPESTAVEDFKAKVKGYTIIPISAVTTKGKEELLSEILKVLGTLPNEILTEEGGYVLDERDTTSLEVNQNEDGVFVVTGGKIDDLVRGIVLTDTQSFAYFQKRLKTDGIIDKLKDAGAKEGDDVMINNIMFTMVE